MGCGNSLFQLRLHVFDWPNMGHPAAIVNGFLGKAAAFEFHFHFRGHGPLLHARAQEFKWWCGLARRIRISETIL
jgi:hypothetical protein